MAFIAKNHEYHDETARLHKIIDFIDLSSMHSIAGLKKAIPQSPAAKSLESSEECKLAYHQKLLSKNDVSPVCIMSSKMGRFSNENYGIYTLCINKYIYIHIMLMSHGI